MSSGVEIPATRTLANVLRRQLAGEPGLQLLLGTGANPPPGGTANGYVNVTINGQTLQVPRLKGAAPPPVGGPAYLLASKDFLLYLGTVSLTA